MIPRVGITGVQRRWGGAERLGVNAAYVQSVLAAGGVPLILPPAIGAAMASAAANTIDALLLSGGEDVDPSLYGAEPSPRLREVDRARDMFELALFACARQRGLPVLGICRGLQLINVGLGGTLWQDLPSERSGSVSHDAKGERTERSHAVRLEGGSLAGECLGTTALQVNSFHHQGVRDLAPPLRATGWAEDGLVEAFEEDGTGRVLAVQWHPEEMHVEDQPPDLGLFRWLVAAAVAPAPGRTPAR